ncbi:167_t:CDS:2, partial [Acaulospora colombiana]
MRLGAKLYYAGGFVDSSIRSNETFYLDLSNSFQTSSPLWESLGEIIPVSPDYSTTILSPLDNSTIYLIGGYMVNPITNMPDLNITVYTFDTISLKWNALLTNGSSRQEMDAVVDSSGKIYVFGGRGTNTDNYYNDINILNIGTNYWTNIPATSSSPYSLADYTATLLPNGIIVYIGGFTGVDLITDLKQ